MKQIVVVGGGGLGAEIIDAVRALEQQGHCRLAGVLDDAEPDHEDFRYLGPIDGRYLEADHSVIIGVGEPSLRRRFLERLNHATDFASVVHPTAVISPRATVSPGTFAAPFTYVGPRAVVGPHCVLNVYASVGHDSRLAANVVLSPYATLNGAASAGEGTFFGTAASAGVGVDIGAWSKVAAGTVAARSCEDGSLVAGNPAKSRVMFRGPGGLRLVVD